MRTSIMTLDNNTNSIIGRPIEAKTAKLSNLDVSQGKILDKNIKIKLKRERREMCTRQKYKQDKHVHQKILRIDVALLLKRAKCHDKEKTK